MKKYILLIIIAVVLFVTVVFFNIHEKEDLKLLVIDSNYQLNVLDFRNGKVEKLDKSIQEYCKENSKSILIVEKEDESNVITVFSKKGRDTLVKTSMPIAQKPVLINNDVFFIAQEYLDSDDIFGHVRGWFLFRCSKNGSIEKVFSNEVDRVSPIQSYDRSLIFVERKKDNSGLGGIRYNILSLDVDTRESKNICFGRTPCWLNEGESLIFEIDSGIHWRDSETGLAIADISTGQVSPLNKNLTYLFPYGIKDNKMFFLGNDETVSWPSEATIPKILDLQTLKVKRISSYQPLYVRLFSDTKFSDVLFSGIHFEWIN